MYNIIWYVHTHRHIDTHRMQIHANAHANMLSSAPRCCPAVGTEVRHLRQRHERRQAGRCECKVAVAAGCRIGVFRCISKIIQVNGSWERTTFHNMIHNHLPTRCGHEEAYPFRSSPTLRLRFSLPTCNCLGNDLGCCCYKMRLSRRMPLDLLKITW